MPPNNRGVAQNLVRQTNHLTPLHAVCFTPKPVYVASRLTSRIKTA